MTGPEPESPGSVDINLAGLLRVRLAGSDHAQVERLERRFGTPAEPSAGAADLTIYWREPGESARRNVVGPDGAWDERGLWLSPGADRGPAAHIPFGSLGSAVEVEVERGLGSVPLLTSIVNVTMLGRGIVPLHAATFVHRGRGLAAAGWSGGGKTEALLAFAGRGASPVSDEWTYILADGTAHGLPTPVRVRGWHLAQRPELVARVGPAARRRLALGGTLAAIGSRIGLPGGLRAARTASRAASRLLGPGHVDVAPEVLFGREACRPSVRLDGILWMVPADRADVAVTAADPVDVAARMALAHVHHRRDLLAAYWQFRYGFPEARNPLLEGIEERERQLMEAAFGRIRTVLRVEFPPRVALDRLRDAIDAAIDPEVTA